MNQIPVKEKIGILEVILNGRKINLEVEKIIIKNKNYFNYIQYLPNGKQRYVGKRTQIQPSILKILVENKYHSHTH